MLLGVAPGLAAAPVTGRWFATGAPTVAGAGRVIVCAGHGCPADPPEIGPACWWFSYGITATGSAGRLSCLSPGNHYLDGLQGLQVTIAEGAAPSALLEPAPLPDPDAPLPPSEPAARDFAPADFLLGLAGFSILLFFWLRPRWPAWRLRRAAEDYARAPSPATLEILAQRIRRRHPRTGQEQYSPLNAHLRELDAARFGGSPLPAQTLAYFASDAKSIPAAPVR